MSNTEVKEIKKPFRTILDEPKRCITPSGEKTEDVIAMRLDDKGNEEFYVEGKTNIYERIQSYSEEAKLETILARCIDTNDFSPLQRVEGNYLDLTAVPENLYEAHRNIKNLENYFSTLPVETREKFDHSFDKFVAEAGTENWFEKINGKTKTPEPKTESEVKENATNE